MKRLFVLLSLLGSLLLAGSCHYDVNLSVEAWAEFSYESGILDATDPVHYGGFHQKSLSEDDLEWIFNDLVSGQRIRTDFKTAILHLAVFDDVSGRHLRDETYGVVYNNRTDRYDFADLDVIY